MKIEQKLWRMLRWLVLILIVFIIISKITDNFRARNQQQESMTFEVTVPSNTPIGDQVYVYPVGQTKYKLEKVADFVYSTTLNGEQLQLTQPNQTIHYRYSRNGDDFKTAEYLEPDTNDYFWTQRGELLNLLQD